MMRLHTSLFARLQKGARPLKEKDMEGLVCYCFGYTTSDIEQDVVTNGKSLIMDRIISEKKAGGCQCAAKNPKGR